jgi:3'-phosphoadenosine 5'-phosphosulfate sulfotransferase (PAPS reductase)/FAD synthetase
MSTTTRPTEAETAPTIRVLSLGAGVQSTTVLMLAAEGVIPMFDAAIFSDTGWEPKSVYDHLDRLEAEIAQPAGIPIHRVSAGSIRDDALDPEHRFASMPLYVLSKDGVPGMGRRQCTSEYKLKPIKRKVRELLGYQHPTPVPRGVYVEQAIGISSDEAHRANISDVKYAENVWPLLELGWTRKKCLAYLEARGWATTPKSACIGCPFHGNRAWRDLRDNHPAEWAEAVEFDTAIRGGGRTQGGSQFLHRSRVPLAEAPIDRVTRHEWNDRQITVDDLLDQAAFEDAYSEDDIPGCSPFACRSDALGGDAA